MENINELNNSWAEFHSKYNLHGDPDEIFDNLKKMYETPKRFYHTFEGHVHDCLTELDTVKHLCKDYPVVYLDMILHDIFYDIFKGDNEKKSADYARNLAIELGFTNSIPKKVYSAIVATDHVTAPKTLDEEIGVNIDLSILGKDGDTFDESERNIYREYAPFIEIVGIEKACNIRINILDGFLKRDPLYTIDHFRDLSKSRA